MVRWPTVDRELRGRLLRELRRRHNVEASRASAEHRLARLDELVSLARSIGGRAGHSGSDEPIELWLRMKSRFRHAGGRR